MATLETLKEMKADPKAKELLEGLKKPYSSEEIISAYAQIAGELGYDITAEDIREALEQEEARRQAETDKAAADMEALEDDDLQDVAGGSDDKCWAVDEGGWYYCSKNSYEVPL